MLQVIRQVAGRAERRRGGTTRHGSPAVAAPPLRLVMGATALGVLVGALLAPASDDATSAVATPVATTPGP